MDAFLVPVASVLLLVATLAYLYVVGWVVMRQKEFPALSKDEIYRRLNNKLLADSPESLKISAGEANIAFYETFCREIRTKLEEGHMGDVRFVVGPKLSTWKSNRSKLDQPEDAAEGWLPKTNVADEDIVRLHPILGLVRDYPEKTHLYLKKSESPHFALAGDRYLYAEAPHVPLDEKCGMLIERPNPLLRRRYAKMFEQIVGDDQKVTPDKFRRLRFDYFIAGESGNA